MAATAPTTSAAHAQPTPLSRRRGRLDGLLFVFLLALAAQQVAALPWIAGLGLSPLVIAIVFGAVYGNAMPGQMNADWAAGVNFAARRILRIAIALYGLRISAQELVSVGVPGLGLAASMVVGTLAIGVIVGRLLRLDRETALLATAGSAICGAAAVLAFESSLRSAPEKSAVAVATVVLFGTVSMFLYPVLYHAGWLQMDTAALGLFVGASVHEVAQVVAAASAIDPSVIEAATITKMARVALLVPVLLVLGLWLARRAPAGEEAGAAKGKAPVPWFVLGFLAMIALNSTGVVPQAAIAAINPLVTFALTMAMAALGMETRLSRMRQAGPRVFALAAILFVWLLFGGYALTLAWV
ncbi:putative sulfate exporter family transporter [Verticiella sediminum]|uniref:Putative sulfate exporter family transporter n=1 Tax=Verticiella sediminum TaxID=1247510 RepID=A0A556A7L1_9BURK|nr:putative sulfate exporter family transporter [Verticiella sediminum]TSH88871.1 putative sulfate exporter family transporter [Verticiella sediminum]